MSPLGIFIDFVFLENNSKHNMINQIQDSGNIQASSWGVKEAVSAKVALCPSL